MRHQMVVEAEISMSFRQSLLDLMRSLQSKKDSEKEIRRRICIRDTPQETEQLKSGIFIHDIFTEN